MRAQAHFGYVGHTSCSLQKGNIKVLLHLGNHVDVCCCSGAVPSMHTLLGAVPSMHGHSFASPLLLNGTKAEDSPVSVDLPTNENGVHSWKTQEPLDVFQITD